MVAAFRHRKYADTAGLLRQAQLFIDLVQGFVGHILYPGQRRVGLKPFGNVEKGADCAGNRAVFYDRLDAIFDGQGGSVPTFEVFMNDVCAGAGFHGLKQWPVVANLHQVAHVLAGQVRRCFITQQGCARSIA